MDVCGLLVNGWILVHFPPQLLDLGIFPTIFRFLEIRFDVLEVLDVYECYSLFMN